KNEKGVVIDFDETRMVSIGLDSETGKIGQTVVRVDPRYFRPTEVERLIADASKAFKQLVWKPKYSLDALIQDMMHSDLKEMQKEDYLKKGGFSTLNYFE